MYLLLPVLTKKVYGSLRSVYFFFAIFSWFFFLGASLALPAEQNMYLDLLRRSSREQHLAGDRYWDILLHYKPHGSHRESLIDDPNFFLSSKGKTDPEAELEATLASFFEPEQNGVEPPRCRFVARYAWLKERLAINEARLPPAQCTKFDEALALINPKSAVLIFPAAHGNGPASMFGHTLIRIDGNARNDLLSYAVNYAAVTTDKNGFIYAYKGIFGFYRGYFSILPYYEKVGEYNEIEHRDIWEYDLNLTEDEVRRMVMHIWELKDIYSDYYFFDENCSFDLLFLLEAARPSVDLTDAYWGKTKFWVIPSDTVRVIIEQGLVKAVKYRPSQARRIRALASLTRSVDQQTAIGVADKRISPQAVIEKSIEPVEKMRILDLSAELMQYRFARKQLDKKEFTHRFLPVLQARSTLGTSPDEVPPIPTPVSPDAGHPPGKFSAGAGYRGDDSFVEFGWRPAYHDLFDPDDGYVEGAQINFMDVSGRYYFTDNAFKLQRLRFIDIVSLAPRDVFFKPVSWKVNTGLDREIMSNGRDHLLYRLNPGGGFAYRTSLLGISYLMGETDLNVSDKLHDDYAWGIGASAGFLKKVTERWKMGLSLRWTSYLAGDKHHSAGASLIQNLVVTKNNSITVSLSREDSFGYYRSEATVMWNMYR
jgi:Domain of unknown function (DUF4105)